MSTQHESLAVAIARAHVEAWSNHDYDAARKSLAPDVRVIATTTNPAAPKTDLAGVDDYMAGLTAFAENVKPGSLRIVASWGDERNALLMLTVQTIAGVFGPPATLPGARLYLLDDHNKIKEEQVVFYLDRR